ncbi:MAG: peptidoglycan editing factor PgeF [Vicinamibacterales bacterium]
MTPPPAAAGFHWDDAGAAPVLRCAPLAAVARHGFTTRHLRLRGADPDAWGRVAAVVACAPTALHRTRQVHGATVAVVESSMPIGSLPEADALVTDVPGAALAVVTADCVPVLLADRATGVVAAVHAGWRGTAADVAGAAVRLIGVRWAVPPTRLVAAVGPSIGACCYEVGDELPAAFAAAGHGESATRRWFARDAAGRLRLDLWTATRDLLVGAGLSAGQIHVAGLCTKTHLEWFESYRAEGPAAGRLAAVIVSPGPAQGV